MLSRRNILAATSAAAAVATAGTETKAAGTREVIIDPSNMTEAQKAYHSARFQKIDTEGLMDFCEGFKAYQTRENGSRSNRILMRDHLRSRGHGFNVETDLSYEQSWKLMMESPAFAAQTRLRWGIQDIMWDRAMRAFHNEADKYLAAMEATDKAGPGTLELNPDMDLPDYTVHEIHRQPGGYVGDPFAGWVYHWALTQAFYQGRSEHDESHLAVCYSHPKPEDGVVKRVLESGCSSGMTTTAYKERFPEAEVWGIDVGGPMVRYAHYRAINMGLDVNFAQRLAEDTKFPDNYFDMTTDYLMFHEVDIDAAYNIVAEMYRILRPGGVWKHNDTVTEANPTVTPNRTIQGKAAAWMTHRHNYEPWWIQRIESPFPQMLRDVGFEVELKGRDRSKPNLNALGVNTGDADSRTNQNRIALTGTGPVVLATKPA